ncbi:MAG: cobalamin-dependent protein [Candidatus Omnitrophota bacterium]
MPYSLLTLAALTPKEYKIKIINQKQFWSAGDFNDRALVGITCLTAAVVEAYQLADKFRRAGSRVVLGGPHVTALPEEALEHADSVVIGEAESVWPKVIADFENGCLNKIYRGVALEDFFTPVYDYFMRLDPDTLSRTGIHIDRGCKYHCDFCARISQWLRFIDIEQVIILVKKIGSAKRSFFTRKPAIRFNCDNIFSDPAYAKELFKKMIPLNITWRANCSIDIGFDQEALKLAKQSGCRGFLIGFETIYPKDYGKTSLRQLHTANDYLNAINNIRRYGFKISGSFIFGLDSYGNLDYLKLLWFMCRSKLWVFILTILTPFPGSALFNRLKSENRILSFDWRKYFFLFCVIKPKQTSVLSVYAWFWFIRIISILFSPYLILVFFAFFISLEFGYRLGNYLFNHF